MNKYRNVRTYGYSSRKEADYALRFQALAKCGEISDYVEQMPFTLLEGKGKTKGIKYIADFCWRDQDGYHVADVKGMRTQVYNLKKRMMFLIHGIEIEEL